MTSTPQKWTSPLKEWDVRIWESEYVKKRVEFSNIFITYLKEKNFEPLEVGGRDLLWFLNKNLIMREIKSSSGGPTERIWNILEPRKQCKIQHFGGVGNLSCVSILLFEGDVMLMSRIGLFLILLVLFDICYGKCL